MRKKIYIAGKVTGLPVAETTSKFNTAQKELEDRGFEVINPLAVVNDWNATWEEAMRKCIAALVTADALYILPCAWKSRGAQLELHICNNLRIPVCTKVDGFYQFSITSHETIRVPKEPTQNNK